jgi:hypothetical protein
MIPLLLAVSLAMCDTVPAPAPAPTLTGEWPAAADTAPRHRRPKAIEYSDWYAKRLAIHKAASWATVPLFVGQYFTGETLITQGTSSPG